MRKLIVFPFNLLVLLLAIPWVIILRVQERARWIDRKIDNFEQGNNKKKYIHYKRTKLLISAVLIILAGYIYLNPEMVHIKGIV